MGLLVGYNYAAKDYQRMNDFVKIGRNVSAAISVLCIVLFEAFTHGMISIFIGDAETIRYGVIFFAYRGIGDTAARLQWTNDSCIPGNGQRSTIAAVDCLSAGNPYDPAFGWHGCRIWFVGHRVDAVCGGRSCVGDLYMAI